MGALLLLVLVIVVFPFAFAYFIMRFIDKFLNNINGSKEPAFGIEDIWNLEDRCDLEHCAKCWMEFLKEDFK